MILVDLQIAARNLARHTRRNLLLGSAIAGVMALLVLLSSLIAGVRGAMMESATTLMTGHVNVGGFYKVTSGMAAPLVIGYEKLLAVASLEVPELDFATARGRGWAKTVSETASMDLVLGGLDIGREAGFRRVVRVVEGSVDELAKPGALLLFESQAKRLGVRVGDPLTLSAPTARGVNNTADVRVVAVAKNVGMLSSFNAYVSGQTLDRLYQLKPGTTGAIHLYLKDPAAAGKVAVRLRAALAKAGYRVMEPDAQPYWQKLLQKVPSEDWTGQKIDVSTWEDEMSSFTGILKALEGLTGLLAVVLMVIVVIGIMNNLWIAIRERTREIGTLRAIGMQRLKVLWLFVLESALLGLCGTSVGVLVGWSVAQALNGAQLAVPESAQMFLMTPHWIFAVELRSVLVKAATIAGATTLIALFPALQAARLKPVTAMHHIG